MEGLSPKSKFEKTSPLRIGNSQLFSAAPRHRPTKCNFHFCVSKNFTAEGNFIFASAKISPRSDFTCPYGQISFHVERSEIFHNVRENVISRFTKVKHFTLLFEMPFGRTERKTKMLCFCLASSFFLCTNLVI